MVTKTGSIFPGYFHANSIFDDGEFVGLRGIIVDITKQKKNEAIVRKSEEMLKKAQTIANTGSWEYDLKTSKIWGSEEAFKIFGMTRDTPYLSLKQIRECVYDVQKNDNALKSLIEDNKPYDLEFMIDRLDNGEFRNIHSIAEKIYDDDGNFIKVIGVIQDITKQKIVEEEKELLKAQLSRSEKMETVGVLAGGVAHDLNNVLSGIVSYPDLLLMDLPDESPMRKPIETIQQSGLKAAAIVQDLLTLARRGVVVSEVVNLNDVISDYFKSAEYEKMKSYVPEVIIETNIKKDLLNILGSSVHLSKTVMNLVTNATEAISGKGKVNISLEQQYIDKPIKGYDEIKEGDYVILKVIDDGVGISDKHINRIFEPFYSKKVMGRSGTGLGMAVVWGTVKDHNGYIDVKTTEGKGTTFSLYFPVTRSTVMGKTDSKTVVNYLGNKESILVIDDVEEQREIATIMLEKLNYNVATVSSGKEAIKYLSTNEVDLLLLDMIMDPGIDGLETYKRIKIKYPEQKAVIASGFSENDRVKKTLDLGAGQYIKKPYAFEILGVAVKTELEK
jgi:two-component system, cell cycle sensor histidine kinase and response regulator CckA